MEKKKEEEEEEEGGKGGEVEGGEEEDWFEVILAMVYCWTMYTVRLRTTR